MSLEDMGNLPIRREQVDTELIPIATDNLVCAICDKRCQCNPDKWLIVSHPKRKGILVFACFGCAQKAVKLLDKII